MDERKAAAEVMTVVVVRAEVVRGHVARVEVVAMVVVRAEVAMMVGSIVGSVVARPVGHAAVGPQP